MRKSFRDKYLRPLKFILPQSSYSQEGEDLILKRYFKSRKNGFYVDVGAHHPFRFSNTALFYEMGWSGINIDATPGSKKLFDKYRKKDISLEYIVSDKSELISFYMFDEPALNTCDPFTYESVIADGYRLVNKCQIRTMSLKDILSRYKENNKKINFLSIDVEGLGYEVLKSNDWSMYRPEVIVVEVLKTNSISDALASKEALYLADKNYTLFSKTINTLFFCEKSIYED